MRPATQARGGLALVASVVLHLAALLAVRSCAVTPPPKPTPSRLAWVTVPPPAAASAPSPPSLTAPTATSSPALPRPARATSEPLPGGAATPMSPPARPRAESKPPPPPRAAPTPRPGGAAAPTSPPARPRAASAPHPGGAATPTSPPVPPRSAASASPAESSSPESEPPSADPSGHAAGPAETAAPSLLPSDAFGSTLGGPPEAPHGRTLHNDGSGPTEAQLRAARAQRALAVAHGTAVDALAVARVEGGLVDPAYGELGRRLRAAVATVPDAVNPSTDAAKAQALRQSFLPAAERYGRTGEAYQPRAGWRPELDVPSELQRAAGSGHPQMVALAQKLTASARLLDFADGLMGEPNVVWIDVTCAADAGVTEVTLVRGSADPTFDAWALQTATETAQTLVAKSGAVLPAGHRSRWALTGRITYFRRRERFDAAKDLPYLLLVSALTAPFGSAPNPLLGRFDELTGEAEYVDLRYPRYQVNAKLLAVY